jgi:SAM-dependent methyltransferase
VRADYAQIYRDLHQRHWWWRARNAVLLREIARHEPPDSWQSILDVGCGDGLFFDELKRFGEVWGVETDPSIVDPFGPHRARISTVPFDQFYRPGRRFRLILMLDVLEHLPDPVGALGLAGRLLEPGGALLITVPAFRSLWTSHDDINRHRDRYTAARIREQVRQADLEVSSSRYLFHSLVIGKLAVRLLERVRRPRAPRVPPGWLNELLRRVTLAEERVLGPARLPFGSSLLAWGRART